MDSFLFERRNNMDNRMTVKPQPSDAILFRTPFATEIVSGILNLLIRKQGFSAKASIHEVTISHSDSDGRVKVHLNMYLDCAEKDIRKLMAKAKEE